MRIPRNKLRRPVVLLSLATFLTVNSAGGATISVEQEITAITVSGSTLTSITYDGTTYSSLSSPTVMVDNKGSTDWLHIGGTAPADVAEAFGSLDLSVGSLNHSFEAQFAGLTDSTLVFLLVNGNDNTQGDTATVYAIDPGGNRLGGVSSTVTFGNNTSPAFAALTGLRTYNRTTGGSANGTLPRLLVGMAFTLEDLGFGGLGATGLEVETTTLDAHEFGLAIPEPSGALLAGLGILAVLRRRRA